MKIQLEDLVKAHSGLASHFTKAAEFHAAAHDLHKAHAAFAKATADGMEDGDVHKGYFTKAAGHHEAHAALHKGMAEHSAGMAAGMNTKAKEVDPNDKDAVAKAAREEAEAKAALEAAAGGTESALDKLMTETVARVTKKALEAFESDPAIAARIQEGVLSRVNAVLGSTIVPTKVKGAFETAPTLIRRPGQPDPSAAEVEKVDASLQDLVQA
jgi:glycine/D-amino acid oxidase-like deaminating enzyme